MCAYLEENCLYFFMGHIKCKKHLLIGLTLLKFVRSSEGCCWFPSKSWNSRKTEVECCLYSCYGRNIISSWDIDAWQGMQHLHLFIRCIKDPDAVYFCHQLYPNGSSGKIYYINCSNKSVKVVARESNLIQPIYSRIYPRYNWLFSDSNCFLAWLASQRVGHEWI